MKNCKKISAIAVLLALSSAGQAAVLNFDSESQAYPADNNPIAQNVKWFGPSLNSGNTVRRNEVNIDFNFSGGTVFGGWTQSSVNVTDNELTVLDGAKVGSAIGGFNSNASAMYNMVTVKGQAQNVIGGYTTERGYARGNSVEIASNASVSESVLGGYAQKALADSNEVIVNGAIKGSVYGGYGSNGAQSNYVEINGKVDKDSYAGYAQNGDVLYNSLILNSEAHALDVFGAYAKSGTAASNFITVNEGAEAKSVIGAKSDNGDVSYNTVDVAGHAGKIVGGESAGGKALNNSVTLNAGSLVSTNVIAGSGTTQAFGNQLRIKQGAEVSGDAYAGLSENGAASYNYMEVSGSVASAAGGWSETGSADFNYVNVLDGAKVNTVYGGRGGASASHNTILIKNASVSGNVYGGYGEKAQSNIVILSGTTEVKKGTVFGGGNGNTAIDDYNVISAEGNVSVNKIDGFKVLKLTVNAENIKVSDSHDSVGNNHFILKSEEAINLENKTLVVSSHKVDPSQDIALLWAEKGIKTDENTVVEGDNTFVFKRWTSTIDRSYEHELGVENIVNSGDFIEETVISPQARTLSKAALSSTALIKQGADFIIEDAKSAALRSLEGRNGTALFAAVSGSYFNYDGDSDFSLRGYHLAAGCSFKADNLMWSLFAETGIGSASLKEGADVDTDISYAGLGALVDYSFNNGMYADAAVRFGYIKTDFDAVYEEDQADFVSRGFYGSIQAGGGYRFAVNDFTKADIYIRYLGLYETSDRFGLNNKDSDNMSIDPRFAHAVRAGGEFNFKLNACVSLSAGAALERSFGSSVETYVNGYALDKEDLDGTSYIGSMGLDFALKDYPDFALSSDLHAVTGDRDGLAVSLAAIYKF
ncbi:autotransporter outer membrane beta-barrel domain-containing protein [Succinatimonas hippei]|uniref:autotransporter outer membrane beta-barrel domain-containing protein n=1 Tax=Succinatimonas hippei TaxID=626938 RepID=UPI002012CFE1|nr:autotransporter outer membrane beta-barrel domain-containing protein [Succinatimonas hippei]MCL1602263.1 autotransporter outer membrane beta-barrel domain-containing protein [Succinatimonas hippei]